ncbi:MAG: NADPH-dependent oxidoreductase [Rhodocyclaceae bacterium]|nr:MAG: NADPH-dependent oxidoreductase [Rhodocyclaceae bacterium]
MPTPRILVFAGSTRKDAYSRKLAAAVVPLLEAAGGQATLANLADYDMPLYNGDLEAEQGLPQGVRKLQTLIAEHDALLIATPEYNGSMTPLELNALDWCSRPDKDNPTTSGLAIFADKPAAILASSPGPLGGLRALVHLRDLLGYLSMVVIPQQLAVGKAGEAFTADGSLADPRQQSALAGVAKALVNATAKLRT